MKGFCSVLLLALALVSCGKRKAPSGAQDELVVFAAASLSDVMLELCDSFQLKHHVKVNLNLASSGTLARQIEHGLNTDVYVSANAHWVHYLDSIHRIVAQSSQVIAYNDLVLIAPQGEDVLEVGLDSITQLCDFLEGKRLSIGDPLHVPAGMYAQQALDYYGVYHTLEKQLLKAHNVRAALMNVEMGEAALGLVYRTDAQKSAKVHIVAMVSRQSHQPIRYVACRVSAQQGAKAFMDFIQSACCLPVWEKYGFRN